MVMVFYTLLRLPPSNNMKEFSFHLKCLYDNWVELISGDWEHGKKTGVGKFYYTSGVLRFHGNISEVATEKCRMNTTTFSIFMKYFL